MSPQPRSGDAVTNNLKTGHKSWVQVVRGAVEVNGKAAERETAWRLKTKPWLP